MKTFTPSATSSFAAGMVFWLLGWTMFFELDTLRKIIPSWMRGVISWLLGLLGIKAESTDQVRLWMREHKVVTLASTEIINYSIHGLTNPLSVMFALGGTLINAFMIFIGEPILWYVKFKKPIADLRKE